MLTDCKLLYSNCVNRKITNSYLMLRKETNNGLKALKISK